MVIILCWLSVLLYTFFGAGSASLQGQGDSQAAPRGILSDDTASTLDGSVDSVTSIQITFPVDGAVEAPPLVLKTGINIIPGGDKLFRVQYENFSVCIEVNGKIVDCSLHGQSDFHFHKIGYYSVCVYLRRYGSLNTEEQAFDRRSETVVFTLVSEDEFHAHISRAMDSYQRKLRLGFKQSLVEWADLQQKQQNEELIRQLESDHLTSDKGIRYVDADSEGNLLLVVGVRTAVVSHFTFRQAIRETWANRSALPKGVKLFFWDAAPIQLEKYVYRDLLTDEMDCDDSYDRLADKTKAFFHFAATHYPNAQYVMVADDDIYLRLDKIASRLRQKSPNSRFYAGHVRAVENASKQHPIRNSRSRNYLSRAQYPLEELPPFALGANFFLSMDCVQFVSKNRRRLRDLGGLDDVSVSLWMLAVQVHPTPFHNLEYLAAGPCRNNLVSLSDLSELAIRIIHSNVLTHREFCYDFEWRVWLRQNIGAPVQGNLTLLSFAPETVYLDFSVSIAQQPQLITMISTRLHAGVKVPYLLMGGNFTSYSRDYAATFAFTFLVSLSALTLLIEYRQSFRHFIMN
ncbi:unnamed protein product [Phytophthora lilii]|uniref:Unnamed protein product n=1 Tax=Phytophthora lilii TaxID=2077276 RepID=A0A9W6TQ40_9STRA|nr:unnamed protein product [Phytophthora lilii]